MGNLTTQAGFTISHNQITYSAMPETWAMLAMVMSTIDSDQIQCDLQRVCFELWRESIKNAVRAAFGEAWMDENMISNLQGDIRDYFILASQ